MKKMELTIKSFYGETVILEGVEISKLENLLNAFSNNLPKNDFLYSFTMVSKADKI